MDKEKVDLTPENLSGRYEQDGTNQQGGAKAAVDDAKAAWTDAREAAADATQEIGDRAKEAAQTARDKTEELAEQGKTAGADHMKGFARAARGAAENLEEQSPEIARYVRQAADGLDQAADSVRNRSVGEFVEMVQDFARRQPAAFFGSTVLAGFVLSRFVKSRSDRTSQTRSDDEFDRGRSDAARDRGERETARPDGPDLPTIRLRGCRHDHAHRGTFAA